MSDGLLDVRLTRWSDLHPGFGRRNRPRQPARGGSERQSRGGGTRPAAGCWCPRAVATRVQCPPWGTWACRVDQVTLTLPHNSLITLAALRLVEKRRFRLAADCWNIRPRASAVAAVRRLARQRGQRYDKAVNFGLVAPLAALSRKSPRRLARQPGQRFDKAVNFGFVPPLSALSRKCPRH